MLWSTALHATPHRRPGYCVFCGGSTAPDGRYAGSAGVLLDTAEFERFYADVQPGLLNVIALHDEEGVLLVRYPAQDDAIGRVLGTWGRAGTASSGVPQLRRFVSGVDGVERLGIAQLVSGYPLRVVVSRDTRLVYAPWREAAWGSVARTLLLCVAASWLSPSRCASCSAWRKHDRRSPVPSARSGFRRNGMRSRWLVPTKGCGIGTS